MKQPLAVILLAGGLLLSGCAKKPKAQAQTDVDELVSAIQSYHKMYARYPFPRTRPAPPRPAAAPGKKKGKPKPPPPVTNKPIVEQLMGVGGSIVFFKASPKAIADDGQLLDPWGTPYKFEEHDKSVTVTSAGPDKEFGTADDVTKSTP